MLAETMVAAFKKGNEGCFACGDKTHIKKIALRNMQKKIKNNKNFQKIFPHCHKGIH